MARIAGVDLPRDKRLDIALRYIYGIGPTRAYEIVAGSGVEGGTKLVHVTFHVTEGPKVKIDEIDFVGNQAISDGKLGRKMKENKQKGFFGFITGGGTYKEDKFAEDAQLITDFYRDEGYIMAQVGQPQMKTLEDSKDGKTRWIQLQVPITEGKKYAVGDFKFEGNKVVNSEALRPLFRVETGETYSQKKVKKGLEKAQEVYGSGGYFEFTAYPDLQPRDQPRNGDAPGAAGPPSPGPPSPGEAQAAVPTTAKDGTPLVDVTMRVDEGKQYFINRITFSGNTTTRDNVIRRELRIVEAGPFNTMALKDSVKRLNQLGYFKPLEGEAVDVQKITTASSDSLRSRRRTSSAAARRSPSRSRKAIARRIISSRSPNPSSSTGR